MSRRTAIPPWLLLSELLAPQGVLCLCCGRPARGQLLCAACVRGLDECRLPREQALRRWNDTRMLSVWAYREQARALVIALKFSPVRAAAVPLVRGMAEAAAQLKLRPDTLVTWVAMPRDRLRERGIDHARVLAEGVAGALGLRAAPTLERVRHHASRPQHQLSAELREQNVRRDFRARGPLHGPVLLIDDVLTTGATARACTECLLRAGATRVDVLTALGSRR